MSPTPNRHEYTHDERLATLKYNVSDQQEVVAGVPFDFKENDPVLTGSCTALDISTNGNFYANLSPLTTWYITITNDPGVDYSNVTGLHLSFPKIYSRSTSTKPEESPGARSGALAVESG